MRMISITEIKRNTKAVLTELSRTKKPIAIIQRSKPVAYIVDPESFCKMQFQEEHNIVEARKMSLEKILQLKEQVARRTGKTGKPEDSVKLIRELREGNNRYE